MGTAQKVIRVDYLWPTLFYDYITTIKHCPNCQIYAIKTRSPPTPQYPIIMTNPFCKWGIDFMECRPPSRNGHKYIIVAMDYFTKWEQSMPIFNNLADTTTHFFFNHVIYHFLIPKELVSNHGTHFQNKLFQDLYHLLGFFHDFSSPYYPQANGQIEVVNHILKTMLQRMIDHQKTNRPLMLFSTLWAYRIATKTTIGFTPFHPVHDVESIIPIECKIPTLHTILDILPNTTPLEQCFLQL